MEAIHSSSVSDLFRSHFAEYRNGRHLRIEEHRAAQAIAACRTNQMGAYQVACEGGHVEREGFHSCHHRSCPRCNARPQQAWLDRTSARLLGVDHFHVIFTLPHELIEVWLYNRQWCSDQLFTHAAESLKTLLRSPRHLGAEPAMLFAQHTWGRNLSFHPHLHGLIAAGGEGAAGQWVPSRNGYLVPGRALAALFRGKWLASLHAALDADLLCLPKGSVEADLRRLLARVARKRWHVRIQGRYDHGTGVTCYLSRYVRGGALQDRRLLPAAADGMVRFSYQDHRDQKNKIMALSRDAFMGRLLSHVPPARRHIVRYYGLYHPRAHLRLDRVKQLIGEPPRAPQPSKTTPTECRICGGSMITRHWRRNENSLAACRTIPRPRGRVSGSDIAS